MSPRSATAKSRCPRTAASFEVTCSSERPVRSPEKMMCTTCFGREAPLGGDRVGDRDRTFERKLVVDPHLLEQLAVQRVRQALARVDAAARAAASTPCRASRGGRAGFGPPTAGAPRRGSAAASRRRAETAVAALAVGQLVDLHGLRPRARRARRAARCACRARPRTARAGRCSGGSRAARPDTPSRRARACSRSRCRASSRGPSAAARSPRSPSGIATASPVGTSARSPGASSTRSQAARSMPASPAYARVGTCASGRRRRIGSSITRPSRAPRRRRGTRRSAGSRCAEAEPARARRPRCPPCRRSARRARRAPRASPPSSYGTSSRTGSNRSRKRAAMRARSSSRPSPVRADTCSASG